MSRQFVEMQGAYKEELEEIENAFLQVRGEGSQKDAGEGCKMPWGCRMRFLG